MTRAQEAVPAAAARNTSALLRLITLLLLLAALVSICLFGAISRYEHESRWTNRYSSPAERYDTTLGLLRLLNVAAIAFVAARIDWVRLAHRRRRPRRESDDLERYLFHEGFTNMCIRRFLGLCCLVVVVVLGAPIGGIARRIEGAGAVPATIIAGILGLPLFLLWIRGCRLLARSGEAALAGDPRQPILYLRPFRSDVGAFDRGTSWFRMLFGRTGGTAERSLRFALGELGPMVAIGRPREKLPPLGAARLYVAKADDWQKVVEGLAATARLVVVRVGPTKGFEWEIRHLLERSDPRRVLVYVPRCDVGDYQHWRATAKDLFGSPLPVVTHPGLVSFDANWNPHFLRLHGSLWGWFRSLTMLCAAPRWCKLFTRPLARLRMSPAPLSLLWYELLAVAGLFAFVLLF
jgi:hypothetical protein